MEKQLSIGYMFACLSITLVVEAEGFCAIFGSCKTWRYAGYKKGRAFQACVWCALMYTIDAMLRIPLLAQGISSSTRDSRMPQRDI